MTAVTFTIEEVVGQLDQTVLSGVIVAAAVAAVIERSVLGENPVLTVHEHYGLSDTRSLMLYALLGSAWNLLGGFAGQVSLGQATFFGAGAYTSTLLAQNAGLSPWAGMIAVVKTNDRARLSKY